MELRKGGSGDPNLAGMGEGSCVEAGALVTQFWEDREGAVGLGILGGETALA